jgi:hypothetical protein
MGGPPVKGLRIKNLRPREPRPRRPGGWTRLHRHAAKAQWNATIDLRSLRGQGQTTWPIIGQSPGGRMNIGRSTRPAAAAHLPPTPPQT